MERRDPDSPTRVGEVLADKYVLDFPLIVDQGAQIAAAYGVLKENGGVARATYLIDTDGRIAYAAAGAHGAAEVLEAVGG